MKKITLAALAVVAVLGIVIFVLSQAPKWSQLEYEAVVQQASVQPDGESRLIVRRTTNLASNPLNSLGITNETRLLDREGNEVGFDAFAPDTKVKVSVKDSFIEEDVYYYPHVYEVRIL